MFRIGSQPPPQPVTQVSSTAAQGGSGTSNQFQALVASLDKAIADLGARFGTPAGGGDSMEQPRAVPPGVGMPGGTVGTRSIAPGEPTTSEPVKHKGPKIGMAGASIGTQKTAETSHTHRHHHHHAPIHKPGQAPVAQQPIAQKPPITAVAKSGSPGATVGTKTPVLQEKSLTQAAPAPASGIDPALESILGSVKAAGGGPGGAEPQYMVNHGGGGLAGGVIGTRSGE